MRSVWILHPYWTNLVLFDELFIVIQTGFVPDVEIFIFLLMDFVLIKVQFWFCYFVIYKLVWTHMEANMNTNTIFTKGIIILLQHRYENKHIIHCKFVIINIRLFIFVNIKNYQLLISFMKIFDMKHPSLHKNFFNNVSYVNAMYIMYCFTLESKCFAFCSKLSNCIYCRLHMYEKYLKEFADISLLIIKLLGNENEMILKREFMFLLFTRSLYESMDNLYHEIFDHG